MQGGCAYQGPLIFVCDILRLDWNCGIDRDGEMLRGCVVLDRERYKVGIFIMREEHFHKEQDYIHQYD